MNAYRIDNPKKIDRSEIEKLAAKGLAVVQFSTASYPEDLLRELNSLARTLAVVSKYDSTGTTLRSSMRRCFDSSPMRHRLLDALQSGTWRHFALHKA